MNKFKEILIVGALIVAVLVGVVMLISSRSGGGLGSALTYTAGLSQIETYNFLKGVSQDIGVGASGAWDPASMSSSSPATTTIAVSGAAIGDFVLAQFATTTNSDQWGIVGNVSAAGTVMVKLLPVPGTAAWNAGLNLGSATLYVRVASSTVNTTVSATP